MLEREREIARLERAIDQAAAGRGSLVLVEGAAGIGKTRLLATVAALAGERELLVRHARAGEFEREMPFGVVRTLLEPVLERCSDQERERLVAGSAALALSALGRVHPQRANPPGDPFAPVHGLYWLLANVADERPVLLSVDDAQWADPQTLRFLEYLARRLDDLAVLVVVAVRSGEPREPAELTPLRLAAEPIRPRPLSGDAVRDMIATGLGKEPSPAFVAACSHATAGNPFLVAEVVRGLRADGVDPVDAAAPALTEFGPDHVARYVLARLGRFGPDAVALARAIAVLGGSPQLRHAATLANLVDDDARELCDRLRDAEILAPGLPIDFVHPLVRQAIYHDLADGERSELHRRSAEILSSTGVAARELAPHLVACAPNGDQWVVGKLAEAALDGVSAGAFDGAQAYLERALAEGPEDEEPLVYGLGRCMLQTDPVGAARLHRELAGRARDEGLRRRAFRDAALGYFVAGDWSEAARCHEELLEILPESERESRLVAEADLYLCSLVVRDIEAPSRRIRTVAGGLSGSTPGECLARLAMAVDLFMEGAPREQVRALAHPPAPAAWDVRTVVALGSTRLFARQGDWAEARRRVVRGRETARELGLIVNQSYYSSLLSDTERLSGRLGEAEAEARTALEIAGSVVAFLNPGREARLNLIAALLARGEVEEAERLADGEDLSAGIADTPLSPWPLEVRASLRLARQDLEGAVADLLAFGEGAERLRFHNPALVPWRQEAVPALAALGRGAEAQRVVAVAEERARRFGAPHVIGTVLRAKALASPRGVQVAILEDAVRWLEMEGPPHELARTLADLGGALRRSGSRSEARGPLRRAVQLAQACGAGGIERRAREELVAAGARPRRAMATGRDSLTATEQRIASLAAAGMSNPQIAQSLFVTRKNVENHLGRIYAKLGIRSRTELPAALGDPPDPAAKLWGGSH